MMRRVEFPLTQRIEIAVMWAFPFSIITTLLSLLFWPELTIQLLLLTWILPLVIFISFPLYSRLLNRRKRGVDLSKYTIVFDFARVPMIIEDVFILFLIIYTILLKEANMNFFIRWSFVSLIIVLLVSIDLMGSTPVFKSTLHEERFLMVSLDQKKCRGCAMCKEVCPRACYEMDSRKNRAVLVRGERCVQCGACIVQCRYNAIYFKFPDGRTVQPEVIKKYRLNLMGKRFLRPGNENRN